MTSKISSIANYAHQVFDRLSAPTRAYLDYLARGVNLPSLPANRNLTQSSQSSSQSSQDSVPPLPPDLDCLLTKLRSLTKKDVGFDNAWLTDSSLYPSPVVYVHVSENETFTLGLFVLRQGQRIPLHDHPGMFGLIKVLHGSIRFRSFSLVTGCDYASSQLPYWQMKDLLRVRPHQDIVVNADSGVVNVLTPKLGNFHEIYTEGMEGAAFFDILAPPYDIDLGTRECHFYEEVPRDGNFTVGIENGNMRGAQHFYLREIPVPRDYFCVCAEYHGPSVR